MSARVLTEMGYTALALALCAVELVALRPGSPVPTFGSLLRWAMRHRTTQLGIVLAWWWLGWHFLLGN